MLHDFFQGANTCKDVYTIRHMRCVHLFMFAHGFHDMFDCIFLRFYISYIYIYVSVHVCPFGPFHV